VPDEVFKRKLHRPTAWHAELGEGGDTNTPKLAVSVALIPWSPAKSVGVTADSVNPGAQDPKAQVSLDVWITEI
jgi:hypothetical protein